MLISQKAKIGSGNQIGHGVIIGDDVTIGDGNKIGAYSVITGDVTIGSGNHLGSHLSIGEIPTNSRLKYEFNDPEVDKPFGRIRIGDSNVIREFTNVGLPTTEFTTIQNDCYIMPHCHIPHDVLLEDKVILANHCSPGGHTRILRGANLGKGVQTHPRIVIGQYAMLGVGSVVVRNVLPAVTAAGNPARLLGINRIGLGRNGFSDEEIEGFIRLLSTAEDSPAKLKESPTHVRAEIERFFQMLEGSRDTRTLPEIDFT